MNQVIFVLSHNKITIVQMSPDIKWWESGSKALNVKSIQKSQHNQSDQFYLCFQGVLYMVGVL